MTLVSDSPEGLAESEGQGQEFVSGLYTLLTEGIPITANTAAAFMDSGGKCTLESRAAASAMLEMLAAKGTLEYGRRLQIGGDYIPTFKLPL